MASTYTQYNIFSENGELLVSTTRHKPRMRGDWVAFFKQPLQVLATDCAEGATIRVYLYICSKQTFGEYVFTTRKKISNELGLSRVTVWKAIKWLSEQGYLQEIDIDGNTGYLINPNVSAKGFTQRQKKVEIWDRLMNGEPLPDDKKIRIPLRKKVVDKETGEVIEG